MKDGIRDRLTRVQITACLLIFPAVYLHLSIWELLPVNSGGVPNYFDEVTTVKMGQSWVRDSESDGHK